MLWLKKSAGVSWNRVAGYAFLVLSALTVLSNIAFRESRKMGYHPYHPNQRNRGLEASSRRSYDFV